MPLEDAEQEPCFNLHGVSVTAPSVVAAEELLGRVYEKRGKVLKDLLIASIAANMSTSFPATSSLSFIPDFADAIHRGIGRITEAITSHR